MIRLAIVVPCYNEEEVLPETVNRLGRLLDGLVLAGKVSTDSGVWLVDDGSGDRTWLMITDFARLDGRFHGVKLSRNRGHQNALLAGLEVAVGDAAVTIDADLQDDPQVIEQMVDLHRGGADIVYGVRQSRATDTRFKRQTAEWFYRFLDLMGAQIVFNHADYRLMSRRALDALARYSEVNLFLRGLVPQLGFATATVSYARTERLAGESKYPVRRMIGLAVHGVTSFSVMPLRIVGALGLAICALSLLAATWVLFGTLIMHDVVPGWASSVLPIYLLGGVQIFSLGVIGEYVGKIYMEAKRRPRFLIQEQTG